MSLTKTCCPAASRATNTGIDDAEADGGRRADLAAAGEEAGPTALPDPGFQHRQTASAARDQRRQTPQVLGPAQPVQRILDRQHRRRVDGLALEDALDQLAALGQAEDLGQRPGGLERLEPLDRARAQDQHAVLRLAAQHLLPGPADHIELGPWQIHGKGGRGRIAQGESLAVVLDPAAVRDAHPRGGAVPAEHHVAVAIDLSKVGQLSCPTWLRSIGTATRCSAGTGRPRACASRTATGSTTTGKGLTLCDATSAAFAMHLPWHKLDVVTWSWQKVLGGEAQHGMLVLSPRAVERLKSFKPAWPLPKIFRLTKGGKLIEGIFQGETINTPSMLAVEDALDGLRWAEGWGGCRYWRSAARRSLAASRNLGRASGWAGFLANRREIRSPTSVCLGIVDRRSRPGRGRQQVFVKECAGCSPSTGRLRHPELPRRAGRPADLVRRHGRDRRCRGAPALARLGIRRDPRRVV